MRGLATLGAVAAAALMPACQSVAESPPAVLAERSAMQCPLRQPLRARSLLEIDGAAQWRAQIERPEADVLGAPVAWATSRVLVVGLGPLPTGGHSLGVAKPLSLGANGELLLQARHHAPPADALVTQVFTAPCLVLLVQRQGWQRARLEWVP